MKKHNFTFSIVFAAILILLPLLLAGLIFQELFALTGELSAIEREIFLLDSKQRNIKSLKGVLGELGERPRRLNNLFIDEKSLVRFIEDLEALAKESGVELKVASAVLPETLEEAGPTFDFSAAGEFQQLFKYQRLLENIPYQLVFEKIETAKFPRGGVKKGPAWSAAYKLKVLSYLF
ncbi:MAG: hypothetical protein Q8R12_02230 [bacterium]|nr:hypothetical protein [bacterium]